MFELKGKYNKDCKIFIDEIESEAIGLIQNILDQSPSEGVKVRIMPDVHAGKGIVIGFTMPLTDYITPGWVGVDLGCGLVSAKFPKTTELNLEKINRKIRSEIPMGFDIHKESKFNIIPFGDVQKIADIFVQKFNEKFKTTYTSPTYNEKWLTKKLKDIGMDAEKFYNSIGTLGGGNHYCEIGVSENTGDYWVTFHSGSRNFGLKIADYWNNVANGKTSVVSNDYNKELDYIKQHTTPKNLIPKKIQELKDKYKIGINKEYLSGDNMMGYLFDMIFSQQYALWNRRVMLHLTQGILGINKFDEIIDTIHNYVDFNDFIIRKGAISSYEGKKMVIPFNMRDGMVICEGKSNEDWNYSGPHGSGRLMSRSKAKELVNLDDFKETMKHVYSTSVKTSTLDESPFAYKDTKMIESLLEPTAIILDKVKPILNIKDVSDSMSWKERRLQKKRE